MWANLKPKLIGLGLVGAMWLGSHGGCGAGLPYSDLLYGYTGIGGASGVYGGYDSYDAGYYYAEPVCCDAGYYGGYYADPYYEPYYDYGWSY